MNENNTSIDPAKKKDSKNPFSIIFVVALIVGIVVCCTGCQFKTPNQKAYDEALENFNAGAYDQATSAFRKLGDFGDSETMALESQYQAAISAYEDGDRDKALSILTEVEDYSYASDAVKAYYYEVAMDCFDEAQYTEAEEIFSKLESFRDSEEKSNLARYLQTPAGEFLLALSEGLMDRWDYVHSSDDDEEIIFENATDIELGYLSEYRAEDFEDFDDSYLGEIAEEYIKALNSAADSIMYYNTDYNSFLIRMTRCYKIRADLIATLSEEYDLGTFMDDGYQSTLDTLLSDDKIYSETATLDEQVAQMINGTSIVAYWNDEGWYDYLLNVTNTTDTSLENLSFEVNFLDGEDVMVNACSDFSDPISSLDPGKSVEVYLYAFGDGNEEDDYSQHNMDIIAYYTNGNQPLSQY